MKLDEHGQPGADYNWRERLDRDVDELMGWVRGIICDGAVTTKEAEALDFWIRTHDESSRVWPVDIIADRLRRVFADGRAEPDELQELEALLESFAAGELTPVVAATTSLPLDDPPPDHRIRWTLVLPHRQIPLWDQTLFVSSRSSSAAASHVRIRVRSSITWSSESWGAVIGPTRASAGRLRRRWNTKRLDIRSQS